MTCCILSVAGAALLPAACPQQRLYFLPLPQGQGAFLEGLPWALWVVMALPGGGEVVAVLFSSCRMPTGANILTCNNTGSGVRLHPYFLSRVVIKD
jgi:hypothetical protein